MIYGSICSGIEAASVAWHPLGWKASFLSEIEAFPRKVLAHHYPNVPLHGDFTTIKKDDYEPIELLVGGTPCQSFSVAGLRAGLNDPRGNLMLEFGSLAKRLQPKWLVWENVPGVLSSNSGRDFGSFLAMLGELGYGFAYRVLDAQHFGVPQRRRRVFVIGCLGDWRSAAAVLFEQHSLQGHPAPSREKGKEVTETLTRGFEDRGLDLDKIAGEAYEIRTGSGKDKFGTLTASCGTKQWLGNQEALSGDYHILQPITDIANTLTKSPSSYGSYNPARQEGNAIISATVSSKWAKGSGGYAGQNETENCVFSLAFNAQGSSSQGDSVSEHITPTLDKSKTPAVMHKMQVRRLMPIECERLQGFPDDYTNIPAASDSTRYKALGNSMAVPVMHWIGKRIDIVETML